MKYRCSMAPLLTAIFASLSASPAVSSGQTDYYNTDRGRPLTVEDAYSTERYAFEIQLAPLRLERTRGGVYQWGVEPELAYGILPRTHIEVGAPLSYVDVSGSRKTGLAGIELSVLHNLNTETSTLPAFGIVGDVLLPGGHFGPEDAVMSAKAIATRTMRWARFHVNGSYTFGSEYSGGETNSGAGRVELNRWLAGLAIDKTFPLRSMLIGAEVFAAKPLLDEESVAWNTAAGIRYQLTPYFNIDGGIGKRLTGDERSWFATFGLSRAFAIRSLFPVP